VQLPRLYPGHLIRRYKRFLADIETPQGAMTIHCPNTGAMTGCAKMGARVWYSLSDNPKRKYAGTWELVETSQGLCSVNTGRANALVAEAVAAGLIESVDSDGEIKAEVAIPQTSGKPVEKGRFDFKVGDAYVEVKSVTLLRADGVGAFPDAVSARALKHVRALTDRVRSRERGILIFCAQHTGVRSVVPAVDIDPAYALGLKRAIEEGVEALAYGCATDLVSFSIDRQLPFRLEG
jgi:sugar fermentation stimulation protein A